MEKNYTKIEVKELENSEIEITGEILKEKMEQARKLAIEKIQKEVEIPGFRKGNVPENILIQNVSEMKILNEAAEIALQEEYPNILIENKIQAIGYPQIQITKIALGSELGFKIKTAVMPQVELSDYKKISEKEVKKNSEEKTEATGKEVEEAIENIQKSMVAQENKGDKEAPLPELNDEFVKKLGKFENVDQFKKQLKENIEAEKKRVKREKLRSGIIEEIIKESKISLPEVMVQGELSKMIAQMKDDVERANLKFDEYLKQIKKTEDDLKKEWRENAEKRAKMQLILNKIAVEEKIEANKDQVKKEVEHIMSHHKEANKDQVKIYVETMLTNEEVFQFLEKQKDAK